MYDVEYSIIQQKKSHKLPEKFLNFENYKKKINLNKIKIEKKIKKFLPKLNFSFTGKFNLAIRVFLPEWKKNDARVPKIKILKKNYYQIISTKVDHAVTISNQIAKLISKKST